MFRAQSGSGIQFRENAIKGGTCAAGNGQHHPLILPEVAHCAGGGDCIVDSVVGRWKQRIPLTSGLQLRRMHLFEGRGPLFGCRNRGRQGGLGSWAALTDHVFALKKDWTARTMIQMLAILCTVGVKRASSRPCSVAGLCALAEGTCLTLEIDNV